MALTPPGQLGPEWVRDALIRYGPRANQVGLDSSTGACGDIGCGPDSAAPSQTGTWWVDDVNKSRLVEFGVDGTVRRVVPLPVGAEGMSQIRVLSDGTVVGDRGGDELVLVRGGEVSVLSRTVSDGGLVFVDDGFSVFAEDGAHKTHRIGIEADHLTDEVASATLRDGTPYTAAVDGSALAVTFGSGPNVTVHVALTAAGGPADYVAFSQAVDASGVTLLVVGDDKQGRAATRLVRVARDGTVTDEPAPNPFNSAQSSGPTLRTASDGVTALSWADAEGLHLYHRVIEPPVKLPPPTVQQVEPSTAQGPVAPDCGPAAASNGVVSVTVGQDGVPAPRCLEVPGSTRIQVENASWFTRYVRAGRFELVLGPGEADQFHEPVGNFLARGWHMVNVYGQAGGFEVHVLS